MEVNVDSEKLKIKIEEVWLTAPENAVVCYCGKVTKGMILKAIESGANTLEELRQATGVCPENSNCASNHPQGRCCRKDVLAILKIMSVEVSENKSFLELYNSTNSKCCNCACNDKC